MVLLVSGETFTLSLFADGRDNWNFCITVYFVCRGAERDSGGEWRYREQTHLTSPCWAGFESQTDLTRWSSKGV